MKKLTFFFLILPIFLNACDVVSRFTATDTPQPTATPASSPTPQATITPTPPPSVALVNGIYIWEEDFNSALENKRRSYQTLGQALPSEEELTQSVLDGLIEETLFLSAARNNGVGLTDEQLSQRIQTLETEMGGAQALSSWQQENLYTPDSFRRAFERESAAAQMKTLIFAERLSNVEQAHVYEIRTNTHAEANEAKQLLDMGLPFLDVARQYDEAIGGDLNWIPRGVMFYPEIEEAIFALGVGMYSDILSSAAGFHIFYIAEKRSDMPLRADILQMVQHKALEDWVAEQRAAAEITMLR